MSHAYGVGDQQAGNTLVDRKEDTQDREEAVLQGEVPPPPSRGKWEARRPKAVATPYPPAKREVEEREATNLPHGPRVSIGFTEEQKGASSPRRHKDREAAELGITIVVDCGFLPAWTFHMLHDVVELCPWALPYSKHLKLQPL